MPHGVEAPMKDACPEHVDWLHALVHEYSCLRCINQHSALKPRPHILKPNV